MICWQGITIESSVTQHVFWITVGANARTNRRTNWAPREMAISRKGRGKCAQSWTGNEGLIYGPLWPMRPSRASTQWWSGRADPSNNFFALRFPNATAGHGAEKGGYIKKDLSEDLPPPKSSQETLILLTIISELRRVGICPSVTDKPRIE